MTILFRHVEVQQDNARPWRRLGFGRGILSRESLGVHSLPSGYLKLSLSKVFSTQAMPVVHLASREGIREKLKA